MYCLGPLESSVHMDIFSAILWRRKQAKVERVLPMVMQVVIGKVRTWVHVGPTSKAMLLSFSQLLLSATTFHGAHWEHDRVGRAVSQFIKHQLF